MPFFGTRREPSPEPVYEPDPIHNAQEHQVPQKKHSIFSRHRDTSPTNTHRTTSTRSSTAPFASGEPGHNNYNTGGYNNNNNGYGAHGSGFNGSGPGSNAGSGGGGVFRRSTDASNSGSGGGLKSLFRRGGDDNNNLSSLDPSILQVREHVFSAEQAEIEADRALGEARMRVREAKDHLWRLEEEAKEEARRAKIKQEQAREVSKRGKGLGRHGL